MTNTCSSMHKRPESVLVIVHTVQSEVLLLRRKQPADFWQSVTGSLEWGETTWQAACRELMEETGLEAADLSDCNQSHYFTIYPMWRHRYAPGTSENCEHVFCLQLPAPTAVLLDGREHQDYCWLSKQEAAQLASSHTNRDAILEWVPDPADAGQESEYA